VKPRYLWYAEFQVVTPLSPELPGSVGAERVVRVSALTLALTPPQPELTLAMLALTLIPILTLALTSLAPFIP